MRRARNTRAAHAHSHPETGVNTDADSRAKSVRGRDTVERSDGCPDCFRNRANLADSDGDQHRDLDPYAFCHADYAGRLRGNLAVGLLLDGE